VAAPVWQSSTTLTGSSTTSAVVTLPASIAADDVVLIFLYKENAAAVTPPAGFTELLNVQTTTGVHGLWVLWKRMAGGETGTVTASWTGAAYRVAAAHRVTGCVTSGSPWGGSTSAANNTAANATPAVSLASTATDSLLFWGNTNFAGAVTFTMPAGYTDRGSADTLAVATKDNTAGGATGTVQGSGSNDTQTAFLGYLLPVVVSAVPPAQVRLPQGRDPGETWWIQRDRSNANLVGTAANPLGMPLAVAFGDDQQRMSARWPLPFAAAAVYAQRDRRDANTLGSGPVAADPLTLPDGAARQRLAADFTDRRLAPAQRPYTSDPAMLTTALLENELLGDATTDMRARTPATHADRRETVPQRSYVDPALMLPSLLENELLGGATASIRRLTPATHADRREVVPPRPVLADQSTPAPVLFDPTLAGLRTAQQVPATHGDRRLVPQQRAAQSAADDVVIVGTGALGAWWSADDASTYFAATMPRPPVPQSTAPTLFDPTLAGIVGWLLNEAATHWRVSSPQQRPVFADPTLAPQSDPTLFAVGPGRAVLTWPTDRRQVPQQRPYVSDPSTYPTTAPTDPLTVAWGVGGTYWLLYNTAALMVDRRQVPQQRRYVSDPATLASALLENELLGGATAFVRRLMPATHADRRQVPWQRPVVVQLLPPVPADPTLLGYLVAMIARTWPTPQGRTWRPQQRAVLYAYGATPPYVRPGRLTVAVRTVGYFTQAAAPTGTITATARSTASLHPDT
jgi:hypothetical protein